MLKRIVVAFAGNIVYRPLRVVLRFFFYTVAVRFYAVYLSFIKKLGWTGLRINSWSFLFDQKLVHVIVGVVAAILLFSNLTESTKAQTISENSNQTILSSLLTSEFGTPEEEQLIEEFFDKEAAISPEQEGYLNNLSAVREQPIAEMEPDEESVTEIVATMPGAVRPDMDNVNQTVKQRRETIAYSVEPGDTVSTIAEKFGISVNTILWANNLSAYSLIRPGDSLSILPMSGVVHTVAKGESIKSIASKYSVDEAVIREFNDFNGDQIAYGQKIVVPGGRKETATYQPETHTGLSLLKGLIKPAQEKVEKYERKIFSGNKMLWPTNGYRITQYFTWRHFAIDIANKIGTPLYAVDSGVVEVAGWGRGYGNQVLIDHGGGIKTRSAHASKLLVRAGQRVEKGEVIALMGSTGWSTGSHIHFEIIINGVKRNPLNYVK